MRGQALFAGVLVACVAACQMVLGIDPEAIRLPDPDASATPDARDDGPSGADAIVANDASSDAGGDVAVVDAGLRCDPTKVFTDIAPLVEIQTIDYETGYRLSADGLEAFLTRAPRYPDASGGTGYVGNDLLAATRADANAPFGTFTVLAPPSVVDAFTPDLNASVSADGKTMYFDSYRPARRVWKSTRTSRGSAWADATPVLLFDDGWEEYDPFLVPDGSALYFTSASDLPNYLRAGHVWRAPIANGIIGTPVVMSDLLNGVDHGQRAAVATPDELVIFWSDSGESPPTRIWTASRASTAQPFTNKRQVAELNGTNLDLPTWISPDACTLYFSTYRAGPNAQDVWVARRSAL